MTAILTVAALIFVAWALVRYARPRGDVLRTVERRMWSGKGTGRRR